jgi:hypothetical protein
MSRALLHVRPRGRARPRRSPRCSAWDPKNSAPKPRHLNPKQTTDPSPSHHLQPRASTGTRGSLSVYRLTCESCTAFACAFSTRRSCSSRLRLSACDAASSVSAASISDARPADADMQTACTTKWTMEQTARRALACSTKWTKEQTERRMGSAEGQVAWTDSPTDRQLGSQMESQTAVAPAGQQGRRAGG